MAVVLTETRLIDSWWSEKIAEAIGCNPYTATDTAPDADPGTDYRKTILNAVAAANLKEKFEECTSFNHKTDSECSGSGIVFRGLENSILIVETYHDVAMARVWAAKLEDAEAISSAVMKNFPRRNKPVENDSLVPTAFWYANGAEAACYIKDIMCPAYNEIEKNYPNSIRPDLEWLIKLENPDSLGKIILFHGPPGLGKTFCVRALSREWSNRLDATIEVVLDPEHMLGSAGYMRSVILSEERSARARKAAKIRKKGEITNDERPLRLIIIEDSAELFSTDCRSTPGFSRLLNLTDGLIGQGLRCIFLLTANEEVGKIDPAIMRAGRCIQNLYFPTFTKEEGTLWLKENNCDKTLEDDNVTLADLYAMKLDRREPVGTADKFGFK